MAVEIAVGDGKITVPKVVGMNLLDAEKALRDTGLTVGKTAPTPPIPTTRSRGRSRPRRRSSRRVRRSTSSSPTRTARARARTRRPPAAPPPAGPPPAAATVAAVAKDIVIPAIEGAKVDDYAAKLADDELVPQTKRVFDASPAGTLFATEPPGGTKAAAGDKVTLLVSAGFPQLAFDDDKNIQLVNGATGKLDQIAKSPAREKDPTYSPDGANVAYISSSRVFLKDMRKPDATAIALLTKQGDEFSDPARAPTADVNLLAMARVTSEGSDLCIGQISGDGMVPRCIQQAEVQRRALDPSLVAGRQADHRLRREREGPVRVRHVPLALEEGVLARPERLGHGQARHGHVEGQRGVLDAAWSPDGSRLALVSNRGGGPFQLYLGKKDDFLLTAAKPTTVRACKVAWRSDGEALVVVQADADREESVGALVPSRRRTRRKTRTRSASTATTQSSSRSRSRQ